jgi:hypothetical protein
MHSNGIHQALLLGLLHLATKQTYTTVLFALARQVVVMEAACTGTILTGPPHWIMIAQQCPNNLHHYCHHLARTSCGSFPFLSRLLLAGAQHCLPCQRKTRTYMQIT